MANNIINNIINAFKVNMLHETYNASAHRYEMNFEAMCVCVCVWGGGGMDNN